MESLNEEGGFNNEFPTDNLITGLLPNKLLWPVCRLLYKIYLIVLVLALKSFLST